MQLNWGGTNAETLRTPNAFGAEYSCFGYDHRTSVASSTLRFSAAFASLRFSPGFSTAFVRLRVRLISAARSFVLVFPFVCFVVENSTGYFVSVVEGHVNSTMTGAHEMC